MNNLLQSLSGEKDSRGIQGIFSRGKNVYHGGIGAAHSGGGPQFGRPSKPAVRKPAVTQPVQGDNPYMAAIRRRLMGGQRGANA